MLDKPKILRVALAAVGLVLVTVSVLDFSMDLVGRLGSLVLTDPERLTLAVNRLFAFRLAPMIIGIALAMGAALWLKIPAWIGWALSTIQAMSDKHVLVLVVTLYASLAIVKLASTPLGFDEAYNLTVPRNLLLQGFYGSTVRGIPVAFDPFISTGPAVLGPIAGLFHLFGDSMSVARLAMAAYHLVFIVIFTHLVNRWIGRSAIPLAFLLLISLPDHLFQASSVLGELPAAMWFLTGLAIADGIEHKAQTKRNRRIAIVSAGLVWGLAILSKPTFVVMLAFSTAVVVYLGVRNSLGGPELRAWLWIIGIAGTLTFAWFMVSAALRGPTAYALDAVSASGAVLPLVDPHLVQNFSRNLKVLASQLELAVLIGAIAFFGMTRTLERSSAAQKIMLGAATCWVVWWLLFNGRGWSRYVYPALVMLTIPITHFVYEMLRLLRIADKHDEAVLLNSKNHHALIGRTAIVALTTALALMVAAQLVGDILSLNQLSNRKHQQDLLVQYLDQETPDALLAGLGWFLAWDVAFRLPDRPVMDLLLLEPGEGQRMLFIVTPDGPNIQDVPTDYQLEPIVDFGEYELYEVQHITEAEK